MFDAFSDFNGRIDRASLRVRRPTHVVFLCGGIISPDPARKAALSVRDYLVRLRPLQKKIKAEIVLAETAQQLYRDTNYKDLISFEEDVARIASIVLVISESAGSLSELGAFASEPIIRDALRILISEEHSIAESFVRFGPVKRIENINRDRLGIFPWRSTRHTSQLIKSSIDPHFKEICKFIGSNVGSVPDSYGYDKLGEAAIFYDLLWVLSVFDAVPPDPLYQAVRIIHPNYSDSEIRDKLYVMKTCRWVDTFSYSGRDYYYLPTNHDPFDYAFVTGMRVRDVSARKIEIATEFRANAAIGKAVQKRLLEKRKSVA